MSFIYDGLFKKCGSGTAAGKRFSRRRSLRGDKTMK
jgi:hypothetical protein